MGKLFCELWSALWDDEISSSQISTSSLKLELSDEQLSMSTLASLLELASEILSSSYSGFNLAFICYSESGFISHGKEALY